MVSKKNFQQNSNVMPQLRLSVRSAAAPYNKKPYKAQIMFGASQIPDNPGFMDFNNPTPPMVNNAINPAPTNPPMKQKQPAPIPPPSLQQKKKNNKSKQKQNNPNSNQISNNNKTQQSQQQQQHNGSWKNKKQLPHLNQSNFNNNNYNNYNNTNNRFPNSMPRGFHGPQLNGPMRNRNGGGARMFGVGQRNERMPPMVPPPHGFQPPPIMPAMVPPPLRMGRGAMPGIPPMVNGGGPLPPPPPPFMRRSARNMPPIPPPIPPMLIPPRMPRSGMPPSVPYNSIGGKIKKHNPKIIKKSIKAKSAIKTLKNLINQYPLDKPWVTNEIRTEHNKKLDIENRLKGNKNDELFAEFKLQRDKFVGMYEAAREAYLKQEAAAVKAKDGGNKDKQTISNTVAQNGNQRKQEAIPKSNNASNANVDVSKVNT